MAHPSFSSMVSTFLQCEDIKHADWMLHNVITLFKVSACKTSMHDRITCTAANDVNFMFEWCPGLSFSFPEKGSYNMEIMGNRRILSIIANSSDK
jgi:hypothetical protein